MHKHLSVFWVAILQHDQYVMEIPILRKRDVQETSQ